MKKHLFIYLSILIVNLSFSQETLNIVKTGVSNLSGEVITSNFHDTKGDIAVSGGGQLQFTLPIALPPSINGVAPQMNLSYSSSGGLGIAGMGFSLSGITNISRVGKNIEKDGESKGVQLDYTDFYEFNGQRLLLKNPADPTIYGKDGTEYVTEKFSTLKIKSIGAISGQTYTGPASFEVTFDNGAQAWYGTTSNSQNPLEYNIVKWKDAQGNYITYNYTKTNNVSVIASVQWGGNETLSKSHFNSIVFNYATRDVQEVSYVHGIKFLQDKILSNIVVNANSNQFKKYVIAYGKDLNATNYQYVTTITEYNAQNQAANPVSFSYEGSSTSGWTSKSYIDNASKIVGDFDGDGVIDYLAYFDESQECAQYATGPAPEYKQICVQFKSFNGGILLYKSFFEGNSVRDKIFFKDGIASGTTPPFTKEEFNNAKAITFKNSANEISARQGILITKYKTVTLSPLVQDLEFQVYSIGADNQLKLEITKTLNHNDISYINSSGTYGTYGTAWYGTINTTTLTPTIKTQDLDGDGLSEAIITVTNVTQIRDMRASQYYPPNGPGLNNQDTAVRNQFVLNLDSSLSYANSLSNISNGNFFNDLKELSSGDFSGNGKIEYLAYDTSNYGTLAWFKKDKLTQKFSRETKYLNTTKFKGLLANAIIGDFNGDKKADFIVPVSLDSSDWNLYVSTGNGFKEEFKPGLMLYKPSNTSENYCGPLSFGCKKFTEYNLKSYQALDLDKDGKSELIKFDYDSRDYETKSLCGSTTQVTIMKTSGASSTSDVNFQSIYSGSFSLDGLFGFSELVGDYQINQINNSIVLLGKDRLNQFGGKMYTFALYDISKTARINTIIQGNIATGIDYKELDTKVNPDFYAASKKEKYPFVELDRVSQSFVVSQLRQLDRKQDFKYRGLLAHVNGRGMIGFRKTARSNWYASGFENTKLWYGQEIDPLQNGSVIKEWSTRQESDVFPADVSVNNTQLLSFKFLEYTTDKSITTGVEAIVPFRSTEKDFLKNVSKVATMYYTGSYYLIDRVETSINAGFATTVSKNEYLSDNASGVGKDYYVGRIGSKTTTVTAYGDTKKAKTVYTFENNLPKTVKTFNQDETQSITETYTYDGFGNVIEKNVTNSKDSQTQKAKSSYDSKGLFVTKSTDNLDLITLTTYNDLGQVLTQTDPLGNMITNTYDAWGKLNTSNSNLSGTTSYTYQKLGDDIIATQNDPTGDTKITYTNKKGEQYLVKTKGFASGSYIAKQVIYDAVGRKVQESEPYYDTESPKWNVLSYDDSVFPAKVTVTGFNGKKLETEVKGLTTTIKELNGYNRTTRKTTDVLGNVKESEDKGGVIKFTYNAAGQNTEALYGSNSVTTKYDTWGRKSEFNDPSNGKYVYEYDGFGTLTKETSPKGTKEFQYNTKGQLVTQIELSTADSGKATNKTITFTYNAKGMVIDKSGTANGKAYQTYVTYDTYGRVLTTGENSNGKSFFKKNIAYDDKSRVISYDKGLNSSGVLTQVSLQNVYSTWSGTLYQVNDKNTAKVLWQLNTVKANGQVLKANLGAVAIENKYDGNNFLTNVAHASTLQPNVLKLTYAFDAIKNELKNRARTSGFAISEVFTYDDNNRLTSWTNPKTGLLSGNTYDEKGRILDNDQTGKTTFKTDKIYQADKQELNAIGVQNFANNILQTISYNENNDPIYIDGLRGDALFSYGLTEMRQMVTYGGNFTEDKQGKFTKYYSEDGSYEITTDNTTGKEKQIMYIGGSPYESDIIYVKNYTDATAKYLFLHKDYLGSILAITDDVGNVVEQRHFDAWGNLSQGVMKIIDRGYTSHEHFDELGIIHMNGRLYDPLQRRFLNADENIQDPNNTQCYNKYGYVMNNPLLFNDPSGEELITLTAFVVAVAIGALVGVAAYAIGSYIANGSWEKVSLSGTLKAAFWGAVSGAVTFGIGECFTTGVGILKQATAFSKTFGGVLVRAAAHGIAQGTLAMMQSGGAGFLSGAAAGFFGSLGATAWGGAGGKWQGIGGKYAGSAVGTIAFGALSGGVGASLTGGNFWEGAVVGGIVSGLNHYLHQIKVRKNIDKRLISKGYKPDDAATISNNEELRSFTEEMNPATLKKTGNLGMYLVDKITDPDGTSAYGETVPTSDGMNVKSINISKSALSSWRLLASTVGHELNHAYHFISGAYMRWSRMDPSYAHARSEYIAQAWEYMNGGVASNNIMMENFNIMVSYDYAVGRK